MTDKPSEKWREFWILGNKCHPDGHIIPDKFKTGIPTIEIGALREAESEIENLRKQYLAEIDRLRELIMSDQEQAFNDLEAERAKSAKLLEALEHYECCHYCPVCGAADTEGEPARQAIAEYREGKK